MDYPFPLMTDTLASKAYYRSLYDRKRTFSIISSLPSSMDTLILRFNHSTDIFWPLDSTSPRIDLITTFPSLERLHLDVRRYWLPSWSLQLPITLTSLQVSLPPTIQRVSEVFRALPSSVVRLHAIMKQDAGYEEISLLGLIPGHFETLVVRIPFDLIHKNLQVGVLASLPRNMAHVLIDHLDSPTHGYRALNDIPLRNIVISEASVETLDALPPYLFSLSMYVSAISPELLSRLPVHLTSLDLTTCTTLLDKKMVRVALLT